MVKTKENMLHTMDARAAHTSASIADGNSEILHQWLAPGVRSIPRVPIAVNTVQRGSAAREIPAERERVASVGRFCGVAQEHSLHDEELGG